METSEYLATVESIHGEARRRGLFFQSCTDAKLSGRSVTLHGRPAISFSSCSYLGLERHPWLIAAVHDAVDRYGTQFSSSRGYLSAPLYGELEDRLSRLFGGHALVTSSTTIGHQAALGVLVTEKDGLVLDHQVHHSVHMAATLCRAGGAAVELVKHGEIEKAEEIVAHLARRCRTVWFACDGVFSMYGDLAPVELLQRILAVAPNVRLYVDDAHGMSWAGKNGRGSFLSRMPASDRVVVATSLNKAFSAAGGCLVFPSAAEREKVRMTGGPMVFSGPVQPPMLGAALASADVHLSPEIYALQAALRERTTLANALIRRMDLPLLVENESPIFFIRLGLPRVAFRVAERMLEDGYYVNVSAYPSVPMKRAGIRLTLTATHDPDDIQGAIERLAVHVPEALAEEGVSVEELGRLFDHAVPEESLRVFHAAAPAAIEPAPERESSPVSGVVPRAKGGLKVTVERTIHKVDRAVWDRTMGPVGAVSWDAMATAERVFSGQARPEHNWQFLYVMVSDDHDRPVGVTLFTTALNKDDMLMRDEVSRAVEARRADDPYFLTSKVTAMGSLLSEGNHLYLDRSGPWQAALRSILQVAVAEFDRAQSNVLILRDLPEGDREMDAFMLDDGFVKVPMLDSHHVHIAWSDEVGYLASLDRRKRKALREVVARSTEYAIRVSGVGSGSLDAGEIEHLYQLYRNVAERKLRLNTFALPEDLLKELLASPAWEIVSLHLDPSAGGPADGRPVAFYAAHKYDAHYAPFFCGIDYRYVFEHGAYRQMIYQMIKRATAIGAKEIHMGMDADTEKHRFGSVAVASCVYVQARDHYNGAVLREIVAEVGVKPPASVRRLAS